MPLAVGELAAAQVICGSSPQLCVCLEFRHRIACTLVGVGAAALVDAARRWRACGAGTSCPFMGPMHQRNTFRNSYSVFLTPRLTGHAKN